MASEKLSLAGTDLTGTRLDTEDIFGVIPSETIVTPDNTTNDSPTTPPAAAEPKPDTKSKPEPQHRRQIARDSAPSDSYSDYGTESSDDDDDDDDESYSRSKSKMNKKDNTNPDADSDTDDSSQPRTSRVKKDKKKKKKSRGTRKDSRKKPRRVRNSVKAYESDSSSLSSARSTYEFESSVSSDDEGGNREDMSEVVWLRRQLEVLQRGNSGSYSHPYNGPGSGPPGNPYCPPPSFRGPPGMMPYRPPPPPIRRHSARYESDREIRTRHPKRRGTEIAHKAKQGYRRVDHVWDGTTHNFKLKDTTKAIPEEDSDVEYAFQVRRLLDTAGNYKFTMVHILSKQLQEVLRHVIGNIHSVNLMESVPKILPDTLFLYLSNLEAYAKELKHTEPEGDSSKARKAHKKNIRVKLNHLKWLISYINEDYSATKKNLASMLSTGLITFELIWALWKPSTLAHTSTYGSHDNPRIFEVESCEKHSRLMSPPFWSIRGRYLNFNGRQFGYQDFSVSVEEFRGARKITGLPVYPFSFHPQNTTAREDLIARGKKFVDLCGVNYKYYDGMAYSKRGDGIVRINIAGRVMVDAATHCRINPNYSSGTLSPRGDYQNMDDDADEFGSVSLFRLDLGPEGFAKRRVGYNQRKKARITSGSLECLKPKDTSADGGNSKQDEDGEAAQHPVFSDIDYLIASPVVLGFSFSEKLWLELAVSHIGEIKWNEDAYDSLVLAPKTKNIVRALVESHKYHAAESIDDVIQGKGKGLVAVLHGPPGTGKTLTAEGISELLKCPLYMASAGELGTYSQTLEHELQKMLDICHAWGAILLLDEADVFLEKRNLHDINRNALVSIFLRQLEYFQGILFLTTNRVETFDDAFQSRIHIALRYDNLEIRARQTIFKMFIGKVQTQKPATKALESSSKPYVFTDDDFATLSKWDLNGRQIKNTVCTAQALAINNKETFSMKHIREVLDVLAAFDQDLKGGPGYQEAMRSYF
ncbi:hypothetical protein BROUX41_001276 [Berkeleyomyces rouxiae]|uniref:uncharacterized protein n=1 Tax=Berkeleyomyces rouxiae TaxID=2035830 RepID=UPI003B7B10D0